MLCLIFAYSIHFSCVQLDNGVHCNPILSNFGKTSGKSLHFLGICWITRGFSDTDHYICTWNKRKKFGRNYFFVNVISCVTKNYIMNAPWWRILLWWRGQRMMILKTILHWNLFNIQNIFNWHACNSSSTLEGKHKLMHKHEKVSSKEFKICFCVYSLSILSNPQFVIFRNSYLYLL